MKVIACSSSEHFFSCTMRGAAAVDLSISSNALIFSSCSKDFLGSHVRADYLRSLSSRYAQLWMEIGRQELPTIKLEERR